jgi:hypothetical protein
VVGAPPVGVAEKALKGRRVHALAHQIGRGRVLRSGIEGDWS